MPAYKFKGYHQDGAKADGEISAESVEEAERRLAGREITVVAIVPAGLKKQHSATGDERPKGAGLKRKISDQDSGDVLENLAVMAATGVPLVEALDAIIESARTKSIAEAMTLVKSDVIGGRSLSGSMRAVPWMFPTVVCDLVRVAEEAGQLDGALASGARYLQRSAELRKRVMQALQYPAVMLSVAGMTLVVLIVFVMPKFGDIFIKMNADVPATTKFMLSLGTNVRAHPLSTVFGIVGTLVALKLLSKSPAVRIWFRRLLGKLPLIGPLLRDIALARSLQSISTLLNGNVPVMEALEHGSKVAGPGSVADALMSARLTVEHGGSLSEAFKGSKVMPKVLTQMLTVGERTGRLATLMATAADRMDESTSSRLKSMVGMLEPLLIVGMGLIVGTITVSVISPIYSVVQNVK
jgi:type II secretory pathway component PulF